MRSEKNRRMEPLWTSVALAAMVASAPAQQLRRVSVDASGIEANGGSLSAAISADGKFTAFSSAASNLVAGDMNGSPDVFHDRTTFATVRVSVD